ncbi:MAG: formamidopyrimidine-DNA glycosylase [Parcubacteria group bacterium Athens1014_10]|nr:MAG: formamidopyrimidine-DNA glycosylase [Parcubacteria group bacterium Athens1014_10]TSD05128.1 MAG: formamidopyrimidine-DNA glycosylase [Parcubacteria group bacterium Athens0714_12]
MPELPEVETIKLELEGKIKGKKIKEIKIKLPKIINLSVKKFQSILRGLKIEQIKRRAKLLIINLSDNWNLIIHLKLTGQLIYNAKPEKHTHLIFYFNGGNNLLFNDLRKFGWIKLLKNNDLEKLLIKEKYGPEPLEKNFTLKIFKNLLFKKKNKKIKPLLMEQNFIAGLGNIYAQEICFYARVRPDRKKETLKENEIEKLFHGIKKILSAAIKRKGTSIDSYLDIYGKKGNYVPFLKVYQREGKKCFRCGEIIKEIKLAGRGTSFCPECQK